MHFHTAPPDPPTDVTAVQSGPTSVKVSWAAPTSGGPVTRYDVYYVASGIEITSGGSTNSYIHVLFDLQVGVQYKIFVVAVSTYMPSEASHVTFVAKPGIVATCFIFIIKILITQLVFISDT